VSECGVATGLPSSSTCAGRTHIPAPTIAKILHDVRPTDMLKVHGDVALCRMPVKVRVETSRYLQLCEESYVDKDATSSPVQKQPQVKRLVRVCEHFRRTAMASHALSVCRDLSEVEPAWA
jgi:hypothetical protein